jgi:mono/diheme cytochrome c family protein
MIHHFKIWVLILGFILIALVVIFAGSLYVGSCSYRNNCMTGGRSRLVHTPIPTLVPAALQTNGIPFASSSSSENCTVTAGALLSAWVSAGSPETQPFLFSDMNGVGCQATFTDMQPLFTQSNLWYPGALACTACHNANLSSADSAQLDLSSYAGVMAGSQRVLGSATGVDILGGGNWSSSKLNQALFVLRQMPYGRQSKSVPAAGPIVLAGLPVSVANAGPTATPDENEIAAPSNSGGLGEAANLTGDPVAGKQVYISQCQLCHGVDGQGNVLNPGSDDGTVPPLNPIDPSLVSLDDKTNAANIDLFIQNGSTPSGVNPARLMPPFGAQNGLTQQQIADVIAYLLSLNK